MNPRHSDILTPIHLSWNVRNMGCDPSLFDQSSFHIRGSESGQYPINGWRPHFLEVPSGGQKTWCSGRGIRAFGFGLKETEWDLRRVLRLPIYTNCEAGDIESFKVLVRHWAEISLPDDMPCLCLAVKCHGNTYETVEAQSISVLMIWNDSVSQIVTLDWCEGPLEDCVTPEWHVQSSSLMNVDAAIEKIQGTFKDLRWERASFSIYTLPCFLGRALRGEVEETAFSQWVREWRYPEYLHFKRDLSALLQEIEKVFKTRSDLTPLVPEGGDPASSAKVSSRSSDHIIGREKGVEH